MKSEKKVSSSVSNWLTASIFVVMLSWVLIGVIIHGPISNLWMGIGGKHQNQAFGLTFLICLVGAIVTLAIEAYFLKGLEHDARSYENSVRRYFDDRDSLTKRLAATVKNMKMIDISLFRSTRFGSAEFTIGEITYRAQTGTLEIREVRWTLEEDRRWTQGKLNSLECPKEPIKVARWRKYVMRQKESITNAYA